MLKMNYFYVPKVLGLTKPYKRLKVRERIQGRYIRNSKIFMTGNKRYLTYSIQKKLNNLNIV
nr:MAG TPA: hypothetical protein [Caudoviricetes sp.]